MAAKGLIAAVTLALLFGCNGVSDTTFKVVNKCSDTIWVGVLTNNRGGSIFGGGFELSTKHLGYISAPAGWSGRFWGRTGCAFNESGGGSCATGDCGRGLKCNGAAGVPPVTLAEFTLGKTDFYDVSLVEGFNVPLRIRAAGGKGNCRTAGCVADLRKTCPAQLQVKGSNGQVIACKSACERFKSPEYCCTEGHSTPQRCPPTKYSEIFKAACPKAYSYAYDDKTSSFTCSHHPHYMITFCP